MDNEEEFVICVARLMFYKEMFIKDYEDGYVLEKVANDVVRMFFRPDKKATSQFENVIKEVKRAISELEAFNNFFSSDLYNQYLTKFKNPFHTCNNN